MEHSRPDERLSRGISLLVGWLRGSGGAAGLPRSCVLNLEQEVCVCNEGFAAHRHYIAYNMLSTALIPSNP